MDTSKKQEILQEILIACGFNGWYVIEPSRSNPANCLLMNPTEKKMGEVSIPDSWLDDPQRHSVIGESLTSMIENSSYTIPYAYSTHPRLTRT